MLLDYHNTYTVQMTVFEQLTAEIQKRTVELERMASLDSVPGWVSVPEWLESHTCTLSAVTHVDHVQVARLLDNLKELWTNIVEFLNYHLVNTDFKQSHAIRRLESYLL